MAVKNANGFIPEIWDASILRTYEANLVAKQVCWDKSKDVLKYGDTIHFNGLSDPTVTGSYSGTLSYETLIDSRVSLLVDQQNTYAFLVDDLEEAMSNVDLKGSQAARAGYELQKTCDAYVLGATTAAKALNTVEDTSLDSATVLSVLSTVARKLDEQNVPMGDKWIAVSPWFREKIILAGVVHQINDGMGGEKGGLKWCSYNDLDIYVTTNIPNATSEDSVTGCLAGSYRAIGFAQSMLKSRMQESKDAFAYYASGLMVYGTEVIFPNELVSVEVTFNAESAI